MRANFVHFLRSHSSCWGWAAQGCPLCNEIGTIALPWAHGFKAYSDCRPTPGKHENDPIRSQRGSYVGLGQCAWREDDVAWPWTDCPAQQNLFQIRLAPVEPDKSKGVSFDPTFFSCERILAARYVTPHTCQVPTGEADFGRPSILISYALWISREPAHSILAHPLPWIYPKANRIPLKMLIKNFYIRGQCCILDFITFRSPVFQKNILNNIYIYIQWNFFPASWR